MNGIQYECLLKKQLENENNVILTRIHQKSRANFNHDGDLLVT